MTASPTRDAVILYNKRMSHYVYIVRCFDGTLYTGYATDVEKRIRQHNGEVNEKAGARYTRGRRPVTLQYSEMCVSRSAALKREAVIKKLKKPEKLLLIELFNNNISHKVS